MAETRPKANQSSDDLERQLNLAFRDCFSTPSGRRVLAYLRLRYMAVTPPTITDSELRYREGQRSIIGVIDLRMQKARP